MQVLLSTPFHPQWHNNKADDKLKRHLERIEGSLLDVGAGNGKLRGLISGSVNYTSLDYPPTIAKGYNSTPTVFGDGMDLPFKSSSFDSVTMLDVLEHIPNAQKAFIESTRVLKPGGRLIVKVPFLYPLHDRPYDFQRWTVEGLRNLSNVNGMEVECCEYYGEPGETGALIVNLGLSACVLSALHKRHFGLLLSPLLLLLIPFINILGYLVSISFPRNDFMPLSYTVVMKKR